MASFTNDDRERQRIDYLVLGRLRPRSVPVKGGKRRKAPRVVMLAPEIEQRVAIRERWSHKQGTPETHEHADLAQRRPGSLARLYATQAIDKDQLAAAEQIAEAYRTITADVAVRTSNLEPRIDHDAHGRVEEQSIRRVHADLTYDWWRNAVGGRAEALLRVIVHDVGLTIVAREHGMSMPRARRMLTDGLDLWWSGRRCTMRHAAAIAG